MFTLKNIKIFMFVVIFDLHQICGKWQDLIIKNATTFLGKKKSSKADIF